MKQRLLRTQCSSRECCVESEWEVRLCADVGKPFKAAMMRLALHPFSPAPEKD